MNLIKKFLRLKETLYGFLAAVMFQLIFVVVWLSGYDGVSERTDQFTIGLLNEDELLGAQIEERLEKLVPLQITSFSSAAQAYGALDDKEIQMFIHIANDFTALLKNEGMLNILYHIEQAAPTLTKETMEKVAMKIHGD